MAEEHRQQADGILGDGTSFYPAAGDRQGMYGQAEKQLAPFEVPVLIHAGNPHEYLFVAGMDGTGNDAAADPEHKTHVARIVEQIRQGSGPGANRIGTGYVAGPGTQQHWLKKTLDGADGYTAEERAETMYKKFIDFAWHVKQRDPQAQISIAEVGFSRGADEVAIFARLVDERGIQDPARAKYTYTADNLVAHAEYTRPPLVPPGQVAQAIALFDPVGTGNEIRNDDRRPPPSVISGLQLFAMDERRSLFKSDHIIDPGISADGRFAGVYVPGAHSDVGGGYHRDGLSTRAGNLVIDYLNRLSDQPFLRKSIEPDDPRLNVVHRSEEGMFIYGITGKVNRMEPEGYNELLVPRRDIGKFPDPYNAEPVDEAVRARYELQPLYETAMPAHGNSSRNAHEYTLSLQVDRMLAAARNGDWDSFTRDTRALAAMDAGSDLRTQAGATADALEQSAMHQSMRQASAPVMEPRGPVR